MWYTLLLSKFCKFFFFRSRREMNINEVFCVFYTSFLCYSESTCACSFFFHCRERFFTSALLLIATTYSLPLQLLVIYEKSCPARLWCDQRGNEELNNRYAARTIAPFSRRLTPFAGLSELSIRLRTKESVCFGCNELW